MIRVIKGSIKVKAKKHYPGDTIEGLSQQDETRLVERGFAEYIKEPEIVEVSQMSQEEEEGQIEEGKEEVEEATSEGKEAEEVKVDLNMDDVVVPKTKNGKK